MLNDILTLDQQWLPNHSDFPPISWLWYQALPSPNYEWFPWSICDGYDMPAGNAYPSGHLVAPPPYFGTCLCSNCWEQSSKLSCLYPTFHLEYSLVLSRFCLYTTCIKIHKYILMLRWNKCVLLPRKHKKTWLSYFGFHKNICIKILRVKIAWNCNFVGLLHHPFWLQLV